LNRRSQPWESGKGASVARADEWRRGGLPLLIAGDLDKKEDLLQ